ncbi:MAG TPA: hypothetical protein VLH09_05550 [Bryobacteraceae bacterium]|nr:hypothetical protein [Bryobacteraceae bacterium]
MLGAFLLPGVLVAADAGYESARRKIEMIEEDRAAPGSRIWLSVVELNAYARREIAEQVSQGLRNPKLELGPGQAAGSALVDFLKIRELKGPPPNVLLSWFLSGEKPIRATARIHSARGQATVHVQQVTISGISARGAVLDFLIEHFLLPFYPEAKIGRPFQLKHNVDRLEIGPAGVAVVMAAIRPAQ